MVSGDQNAVLTEMVHTTSSTCEIRPFAGVTPTHVRKEITYEEKPFPPFAAVRECRPACPHW